MSFPKINFNVLEQNIYYLEPKTIPFLLHIVKTLMKLIVEICFNYCCFHTYFIDLIHLLLTNLYFRSIILSLKLNYCANKGNGAVVINIYVEYCYY